MTNELPARIYEATARDRLGRPVTMRQLAYVGRVELEIIDARGVVVDNYALAVEPARRFGDCWHRAVQAATGEATAEDVQGDRSTEGGS